MWQAVDAAYPPHYHPVHFLVDALKACGFDAAVIRDERTEGCYGGRVGDQLFVWLIDNRLPHEAAKEDFAAERLHKRGVPVFCAQKRDAERVDGIWLPLAVTPAYTAPDVLTTARTLEFDLVFIGYVRDTARATALEQLAMQPDLRLHVASGVFNANAAALYRRGRAGLNIPTLYGAEYAYDINMRIFEIAATGVPLITNFLPELIKLQFAPFLNCLTYRAIEDIPRLVSWLRAAPAEATRIGAAGRSLVLARHTYRQRAMELINHLD